MIPEERRREVRDRVVQVLGQWQGHADAAAEAVCDAFSLPETLNALGAVMNWHEWRERWGEFMAKNPRSADNSNYWAPHVALAEEDMKEAIEEVREASRRLRERKRLAA